MKVSDLIRQFCDGLATAGYSAPTKLYFDATVLDALADESRDTRCFVSTVNTMVSDVQLTIPNGQTIHLYADKE